jgi:hypothetical protein
VNGVRQPAERERGEHEPEVAQRDVVVEPAKARQGKNTDERGEGSGSAFLWS